MSAGHPVATHSLRLTVRGGHLDRRLDFDAVSPQVLKLSASRHDGTAFPCAEVDDGAVQQADLIVEVHAWLIPRPSHAIASASGHSAQRRGQPRQETHSSWQSTRTHPLRPATPPQPRYRRCAPTPKVSADQSEAMPLCVGAHSGAGARKRTSRALPAHSGASSASWTWYASAGGGSSS